jgi:hypothetical protein
VFSLNSLIAQPPEVLSPGKINKLVPSGFEGFRLLRNSKGKQIKEGPVTYAACERTFVRGKKSVKILLLDYVDAPILYQQAMKKWDELQEFETDSAIFRSVDMKDIRGWESYSKTALQSQLIFGINDRFLLTLSGENMELYELKQLLQHFDLHQFPR